ncbi:MAG: archaeosortase/exosortase family protein [Aquabacterium sp.]
MVVFGLLLMYAPTYATLDRTIWNIVGQGHGPVMLALTLWLIWQRLPAFTALTTLGNSLAGGIVLTLGLLVYVVGHSQDILFMDVGSQILVLAGVALLYRGWAGLKLMWFPLFFILFIVPVPGSVVDQVTAPLKAAVSYTAENLLYALHYPIGRSGVTLTIGPYQLLVADACAGSEFDFRAGGHRGFLPERDRPHIQAPQHPHCGDDSADFLYFQRHTGRDTGAGHLLFWRRRGPGIRPQLRGHFVIHAGNGIDHLYRRGSGLVHPR